MFLIPGSFLRLEKSMLFVQVVLVPSLVCEGEYDSTHGDYAGGQIRVRRTEAIALGTGDCLLPRRTNIIHHQHAVIN